MQDCEHPFSPAPKLLVAITDRDHQKKLEDVLREKHVLFSYVFHAMGTASSEILKAFGLSGTEKIVSVSMEPAVRIKPLMTSIVERLEFVNPGHGIAFTMPVSGVSATISNAFSAQMQQQKERLDEWMDREAERTSEDIRHELVVAVINQGFSDILMDAARDAGARGGTIVHARRSGAEEAAKFFGISIQEEKEIVAILIHKEQKKELMQAVSKTCGMRSEARGIIFSLPVESCAGISSMQEEEQE